jgi:hypothetical protein
MRLQTETFVSKPIRRIRRVLSTAAALFLLLDSGMKVMELNVKRTLVQLGYADEAPFGAGTLALIVAVLFARFVVHLFPVQPW